MLETTHDHPFLSTVYDDAERYDLEVELAFLLLHHAAYRRLNRSHTVVLDFSPVKDLLFAEAMLSGKDRAVFEALYEHVYAPFAPPDLVVYLDASPELSFQRVMTRLETEPDRRFEAEMDIDRLRLMCQLYDARLAELGREVVRLEVTGSQDPDYVADALARLAPNI